MQKCDDCGRDLLTWPEARVRIQDLLSRFIEEIDKKVEEGKLKFDEPIHEHAHLEGFMAWLLATEKMDVRGLLELLGEVTKLNIVAMVNPPGSERDDLMEALKRAIKNVEAETKH